MVFVGVGHPGEALLADVGLDACVNVQEIAGDASEAALAECAEGGVEPHGELGVGVGL